jgi:hypothetical protein
LFGRDFALGRTFSELLAEAKKKKKTRSRRVSGKAKDNESKVENSLSIVTKAGENKRASLSWAREDLSRRRLAKPDRGSRNVVPIM